jgi:hypothetical protein
MGGVLFALAHLCTIHPTTHPIYVFLLLINDTHIIGIVLNVLPIFLQLQKEFGTLRLLVQSTKCVNHTISLPPGFLTLESNFIF